MTEGRQYRIHVRTPNIEVDVAGSREFVVEQFEEKFERLWESPQALPEGVVAPQLSTAGVSIVEYVNALEPKKQTDVALAIVGYLFAEKNVEELGKIEVEEGFREILRPVPGNTSQTLANLVRQGLLMKRGKREGSLVYSITQSGLARLETGFRNSGK